MCNTLEIHMYGLCTKVFEANIGRITLGIIPFERKRRRETNPNVKLILPHLWRANYIVMVWKSSRHHVSELSSPLLHGWEIVDDKNVPIKCLKPAAPEAMLALVKCGCKRGCSEERHCVCLRK